MTLTVSYDGNNVEIKRLTVQPVGHEEIDVLRGRSATLYRVSGLCTPGEWIDLLGIYNDWKSLRQFTDIKEPLGGPDVTISGTGPSGSISANCWFKSAPSAEQSGAYLSVSFELVDSDEYEVTVLLGEMDRSLADSAEPFLSEMSDLPTTFITKVTVTYRSPPSVNITAAGKHYLTGPTIIEKVRTIEGKCYQLADFNNIKKWYEDKITDGPSAGLYFPISPLSAQKIKGVRLLYGQLTVTDVYQFSFEAIKIV